MAEQVRFLAYCAEIYKENKNMTGRELYELFTRYGVWGYVYECFDALHTTGDLYTIDSIDKFISVRR